MEASTLTHASRGGLLGRRSPLLKLQADEKLVALIREGHEHAFDVLFDRYHSRLLAFCRNMLRSTEDAEDVLQEVFVKAHAAMLADERHINARPWLYRIARNRCLNHLRRPVADGVDTMDVLPSEHGVTTAERVQKREDFRCLVEDVGELPETQRTALLLRELDALSYEEIATAMDTTVPAVKSLLVRARMSLAEATHSRQLTCGEVRLELAEAAEGLRKASGPVRYHVKRCEPCRDFRGELRENSKALAALAPIGPLAVLHHLIVTKLGGLFGGSGAAAGGSGVAGGSAAAGTGAAIGAGGAGTTAVGGAAAAGAGAAGTGAAVGGGGLAVGGAAAGGIGGALGAKAAVTAATGALLIGGVAEVRHLSSSDGGGGTEAAQSKAAFSPPPAEGAGALPRTGTVHLATVETSAAHVVNKPSQDVNSAAAPPEQQQAAPETAAPPAPAPETPVAPPAAPAEEGVVTQAPAQSLDTGDAQAEVAGTPVADAVVVSGSHPGGQVPVAPPAAPPPTGSEPAPTTTPPPAPATAPVAETPAPGNTPAVAGG
jgi:RNA polymerase sigma factor (sigma-70 family)